MSNFAAVFKKACTAVCLVEDRRAMQKNGAHLGDGILGTAFLVSVEKDGSALFGTAGHLLKGYSKTDLENVELRFCYSQTDGKCRTSMGVMDLIDVTSHPTVDASLIHATPATNKRLIKYNVSGQAKEEMREVGAKLHKHVPLDLGTERGVVVGAELLIIGFGQGKSYVFLDKMLKRSMPKTLVPIAKHGIVAQVVPADGRPIEVILYDIQTAPGFSGSPVILIGAGGARVVGIHTNGLPSEDVGYAHAIRFLRDLLSKHSI